MLFGHPDGLVPEQLRHIAQLQHSASPDAPHTLPQRVEPAPLDPGTRPETSENNERAGQVTYNPFQGNSFRAAESHGSEKPIRTGDKRLGDTGVETHLTSPVSLAGHWTTLLRTKKLAFQEIEKRVLVHHKELERFAAITTISVVEA